MALMNKWLLIFESCGDSNRCTPCRGKPNQHFTRIPRSVRLWSQTIRISRGQRIASFREVINRFVQIHCPPRRRAPDTIHSSMTVWSAGPYPASLPQQLMRHWGKRQPSVDNQLLGLAGPYHRHAIDTFNTCSRVPTPRSLTDTGGGYHIETSKSPQHSSHPSLPSVPLVLLIGPAWSPFYPTLNTGSKAQV
jgi:hypothetical protein